eukprot:Polyplicarium_translucidae@DN857_c0_g1_i1.p1
MAEMGVERIAAKLQLDYHLIKSGRVRNAFGMKSQEEPAGPIQTSDQLWWAQAHTDFRQYFRYNLWSQTTFMGDNFFVVFVDNEVRIRIAHVVESTGFLAEHYLDADPEYVLRFMVNREQRTGVSIGIDEKGYVHVTGDMIFFPYRTKWNRQGAFSKSPALLRTRRTLS